MKKIIILFITIFCLLFQFTYVSAADGTVSVIVTERIPGANCTEHGDGGGHTASGYEKTQLYSCEVKKGAGTVIAMLGNIIKYFTYIASLVGVLFIVYNGILYSMGGLDESFKKEAKDRIVLTIIGLLILLLAGPILKILAPWIYN